MALREVVEEVYLVGSESNENQLIELSQEEYLSWKSSQTTKQQSLLKPKQQSSLIKPCYSIPPRKSKQQSLLKVNLSSQFALAKTPTISKTPQQSLLKSTTFNAMSVPDQLLASEDETEPEDEQKPYSAVFYNQPEVVEEKVKQEVKKRFSCEQCTRSFNTLCQLNAHRSSFHENERYMCLICEKVFTYENSFLRHRKSHNISLNMVYTCPYCSKSFVRSDSCTRHIKTHLNSLKKVSQNDWMVERRMEERFSLD